MFCVYICFKLWVMKFNIAVISGGNSGEFDISVQSGEVVLKYLDPNKFKVYPIMLRGTEWYYACKNNSSYMVDKNDFTVDVNGGKIKFDCVFIAIHGTPGEDGKLQGYFDILNIPYTSCDHATSALTFNKYFCTKFVSNFNVKTANSIVLSKSSKFDIDSIQNKLSLPLFVKPNNGGSSVGMSKVNKPEHLQAAIEKAFNEDDEILLEEFIEGREITCGVIKQKGEIIILPVAEIISKNEFFDFEAKYEPTLVDEVVPAKISSETEKECKVTSSRLYEELNCKGVVRFDYIFNDDGLYFLEVNTIPGLTEASIVPKMAKNYGMTLTELFGILVEEALVAHQINPD